MKPDIGFQKIRRRVVARAMREEGGLLGREGIRAAEQAGSCTGKKRFETHSQAQKIINRKGKKRHDRRCVYFCRSCGGFHVGTHSL
jgi:hypothetical protein